MNRSALHFILRANEFKRQTPQRKLELALTQYQLRVCRGDKVSPRPDRIRVRVTSTRRSRRPFFVVQVRTRYIAAYTLDKLIEKIALGHYWNRADIPCGVAVGALV